jgi:ribonuclease P protein component
VDKPVDDRRLYLPFAPIPRRLFHDEADLPAKRPTPQAQARLPCSDVDARRAVDPEAPPAEGPREAFGVAGTTRAGHRRYFYVVKRANRLSRSRDFDAVYRHGRSVSSRFLVLYWFGQEEPAEPRFGMSVPRTVGNAVARNKLKRQLRELWRARLERVPTGRDYVLIVRPGVAEAAAANGPEWLAERVDEVLDMTKAAA